MATQIVMDHTGDTRHQFDQADAGAVAEAERRRLHRRHAARRGVLKSFDPTAEETLFIPRLQGG
jgi:hypothetical protein